MTSEELKPKVMMFLMKHYYKKDEGKNE